MPTIVGTSGNDNLVGTPSGDHLQGLGGNDNLDGRDGVDVLEGGSGNDNYFVDPGDSIIEAQGAGLDIVYARGNYTLGAQVHVEALNAIDRRLSTSIVLTGNDFNNAVGGDNGNNRLYGRGGADTLRGYDGNDTLDGGAGADLLIGGAGNDNYYVDSFDKITELAGEGMDIVYALESFSLGAGVAVELLTAVDYRATTAMTLRGNELNNSINGNNGNNSLFGGGGADTLRGYDGSDNLDGGDGADQLIGGLGNDNYFVDGFDRIVELDGEGIDTVYVRESFALTAGASVEVVTAIDIRATTAMTLRGNELNNSVNGNDGANALYGGAGVDTLRGYGGNDNLHGDAGADVLIGGLGNDNYFVDALDRITELAGEGTDTAYALESYTLAAGVSIEVLSSADMRSTTAMTLRGNELDNTINGNNGANSLYGGGGVDTLRGYDGADILDGGADADRLIGGLGDDSYYVDGADILFENAGEGFDTVYAAASYALAAGVSIEALSAANAALTTAMTLSGNEIANTITGNAGANRLVGGGAADTLRGLGGDDELNGGTGADLMEGGAGNDIYHVDDAGDQVVEASGAGTDEVRTTINFALAAGSHVERLVAAQPAAVAGLELTGNAFANTIVGNAGANVLNGGLGADTLTGLGGNDIFDFTTALGGGNIDAVTDFAVGQDLIRLAGASGQPFAALASGQLAAHAFAANTTGAAATASQMIIYNSATGAMLYDADGSGGAAAVQFATLAAGLALSASDIFVSGPANSIPVISSGTTASIAENSPTSTVVYQVQASDPNGDRITYSLSGADASLFSIDQNGAVRFLQSPNFEARSSFSIAVEARDSSGMAVRGVNVSVTDVAEGPPPAGATPVLNETSGANDGQGSAQAIDRALLAVFNNPNLENPALPSIQINGAISTPSDQDFFSITLQAGELLILDVDGTATGGPQVQALDAYLRVFGPNGSQITFNDDLGAFDAGSSAHSGASHNMDSLVRFRAPTTGTYTFSIASFADSNGPTSSGSYIINVSVGPQGTPEEIDQENVQSLISGSSWSGQSVTYGFPTDASQYPGDEGSPEKTSNFEVLNGIQQAASRTTFALVSQYTLLTFSENAGSPGSAQMRLAQSDDPETAHAYYPGLGDGGDAWFRNSAPPSGGTPRYDNPVPGNYGYMTFLHEIGHALGLKHGHESPALSPDRDSMEFSIMTYRGYIGADFEGGYLNETWGFAQTFMMYDIAALQEMYGVNWNTNSGDTTYSWNPGTGAFSINGVVQWTPGGNRIFQTIWDGGGTDTYDLSSYTGGIGATIDLRPGEWSTFDSNQRAHLGGGNMARGNVANSLLHDGDTRSLIENVIGTAQRDSIIGNDVSNRLIGGEGQDFFQFYTVGQSSVAAPDTLADFTVGSDTINLAMIDTNPATAGDDAFTFIGTNAFSGKAAEVRLQVENGVTHVYGDTNGDAVADLHIIVNAVGLTATDFNF